MLDAAGGAMLLELLSEPDYVQAGPSSAEIGASQFDAAASQSNTPPSNLQLAPLAPVNEGGVALLQGTFDDPDAAGPHVVEINWGDDSPLQVITLSPSARSFSATHQYLDDNPTGTPSDQYTIQVRVIDPAGDAATATTTVTVNNVPPTNVLFQPLGTIDENGVATLNLSFTDPGTLDTHTVEINWGDGSPLETFTLPLGARTLTATHQYLDDNPTGTPQDMYAVTVRVIDDDGGQTTFTGPVTVRNVAPSNVQLAPVAPILEHGVATLQISFDDPGTLDVHRVEIDWGDGSPLETLLAPVGARSLTATHQYLDDHPSGTPQDDYLVRVRVLDDDGGASAVVTTTVTVNNVPPTNVLFQPLGTIDENGVATLNLSFTDPGTLDTHTVEINWGDGSPLETFALPLGARTLVATHQYLDDNPTGTPQDMYAVTVRVIDDDGGQATFTGPVTVRNVPPSNVQIIPAATVVDEGTLLNFSFSFDDPGTLDTHTFTVDWGDGKAVAGAIVGRTFAASHTYADDGVYTVRVRVTDDDTGVGEQTIQITVNNVPPTLTVVADQTINEGSLLSLPTIGTFTDPGFDNPLNTLDPANGGEVEETFTFEINWGDGTAPDIGFATITTPGGPGVLTAGSFPGMHTYADNGVYTVTVTVMDDDGGTATQTFRVTVLNVDPTLRLPAGELRVDEGQAFTLAALGVLVEDPGFNNPANAGNADNGGEFEETFVGVSIDWGDGRPVTPLTIGTPTSGSPGVMTTAPLIHAPHVYADNGVYTVTVLLSDDDGPVVARTLTIIVDNVPPTLVLTTEQFVINEGDTLTIPLLGTFSDPGFDNPANAGNAANGGEVAETFTYIIDWGDGTVESFTMPATRISGGPGVPTTGTLSGEHRYLDNDEDNKYTITVTLMDDDGGVAVGSFEITVWNVNPTLKPVSATDVNAFGQTTLTLEFSDPGADEFEILVDWGDKLHLPPDQRFVVAAVHAGPTPTTFVLTHTYAGPPDPLDPAADIKISVKIRDDDFGTPGVLAIGESNLEFAVITNPGEGNKFVRIDLSPRVPMLTFPVRPISPPALPGAKAVVESSSLGELQGSSGEALASSERFFELRIVDAQGDDVLPGYRLPPDVLDNLPALFRRLPDNTYRIYLVQGDSTSVAQVDRLVIEVVVRNGRMIDPGDDAEGARDRPPTDEAPAPNIDLPAADAPADQGARFDGPRPDSAASREPLTVGLLRRGSTLAAAALTLSAAGRASQAQLDAQQRPAEQRRRPLKSARHWRPRKPR